jgi:hypothetical protein
MFQSDPQTAILIQSIATTLREISVGETKPYSNFPEAPFWVMARARKLVESEDGSRFATVRRVGIMRLKSEDIPGIGSTVRAQIGRKAKTAFSRLTNIRANDVTPDIQARIDAERSLLGAVSVLMKDKSLPPQEATKTGPEVAKNIFSRLSA